MAKKQLGEKRKAEEEEEVKPKKAKAVKKVESDSSSDEAPPAKKAPAKKAAVKKPVVADSDDSSDDAPAPKAKAAAKKAAPVKKAADSDDSSDDAPAPKKAAPAKKAAADDEEEEAAPPARAPREGDDLKVFVGGLPWSLDEETIQKDFTECGEITDFYMPKNEEGKPKGFAFVTFADAKGLEAALKFDGEDYGGRRLKVNKAGEKPSGDKGKGKGKDGKGGKGKQNDALTAFVGGLSWDLTEEVLRKDFEECGEITRLNLPMNDEGKPRGIAFISFATEEALTKALEFNEQEYSGRTISVRKAGEGGKGKDGKGKDGKGKDKGKGKGKGKDKGKKGGMSYEKMAAKDGAMVESTGVKKTFDDDSDDEPAPKKAKKAAPPSSDSE